jgi:hypothetical protein
MKKTTRKARRATTHPPADLHLRLVLAHLDGAESAVEGSDAYSDLDAIAHASIADGDHWFEALKKRLETTRPKVESRTLHWIQYGTGSTITIDRLAADSLIVALTNDAFLVGAAAMYQILKGGAK